MRSTMWRSASSLAFLVLVTAGAAAAQTAYPNVKRWLSRMKALKSWPQVYQVIDGFAASLKGKSMVSV